jgi:prophage regulatory protein
MKLSTTIGPMAAAPPASVGRNKCAQPRNGGADDYGRLHVFPTTGFVRLAAILGPKGPIPVGRTTWWEGVKSGRFPKPTKLGPRITVWRAEDIRKLFDPEAV